MATKERLLSMGLAAALALASGQRAATCQSKIVGAPVIFVHGICDQADRLLPFENSIKTYLQLTFPKEYLGNRGGGDEYIVYFDGSNVVFQIPHDNAPLHARSIPVSTRFFIVALDDPGKVGYESFDPTRVANVPIYRKSNELANIIWGVKTLTGAPRVIVIGHSMGGLDTRAYIEGLARDDYGSVPYFNDISHLITLDTPHGGSDWASLSIPRTLPWFRCIQASSEDKNEMLPGSSVIKQLDYYLPGAQPLPRALSVHSIDSTWNVPFPQGLMIPGTDDVVSDASQDLSRSLSTVGSTGWGQVGSQLQTIRNQYRFYFQSGGHTCGLDDLLHSLECVGHTEQTLEIVTQILQLSSLQFQNLAITAPTFTVTSGRTLQLSAKSPSGQPLVWSILEGDPGGRVSPKGLYSAPLKPGLYHAVVIDSGHPNQYGEAAIAVVAPPVTVNISPTSVSLEEGDGKLFKATVSDASKVTWQIREGIAGGTLGDNGNNTALYTAPNTTGTFHVVATSSENAGKSATAAVTVTAKVTLWAGSTMFGMNPQRTNTSGAAGPSTQPVFTPIATVRNGAGLWRVSSDGTVIVASRGTNGAGDYGWITAFADDGALKWDNHLTTNSVFGFDDMAIGPSGAVYLIDASGTTVTALDGGTGVVSWSASVNPGANGIGSILVDEQGVIYVESGTKLTAVTPGGSIAWSVSIHIVNNSAIPVMSSDERLIYLNGSSGSPNYAPTAIDYSAADGSLLNSNQNCDTFFATYRDATVYGTNGRGDVVALSEDLSSCVQLIAPANSMIAQFVEAVTNQNVIVTSQAGGLSGYSSNGSVIWGPRPYRTEGGGFADAKGILYERLSNTMTQSSNQVEAIDANTGQVLWQYSFPKSVSISPNPYSILMGPDGSLYVISGQTLYRAKP